jgi:hypothetical protein
VTTKAKREIELSNSDLVAVVDEEDYVKVAPFTWRLMNTGYVVTGYVKDNKNTFKSLHRHVLGLSNARKPVVDHINRNKLDNTKDNLRICTQHENMMNSYGYRDGVPKGVYELPNGRFRAMIRTHGKLKSLGCFDTVDEAVQARVNAERELTKPATSASITE